MPEGHKPMRFALRVRMDDASEWGEWELFPTMRARDKAAMYARIIGGLRVHSADLTKAEAVELQEAHS